MPDILFRNAAVAPATADEAARTVEVVWSTGAAVRRFDLDGPFTEVLSLDPAHVDLSRLIGASVLDAHQQAELRNVLGVVLSANVDGRHGTGTLQFSARPDVEPIWQDVRAGILRHISVGYTVEAWQDSSPAGERIRTAIAWTPIELSFVPTPADPGASTRTAGGTMDPEQTTTETPSADFTPCPDCPSPEACRSAGSCLLETEVAATEASVEQASRARPRPPIKRKPAGRGSGRRDLPPAPPEAAAPAPDFVPCAECQTPNGCSSLGACVREAEAAAGDTAPEVAPADASALVERTRAGERHRVATIYDLAQRLGLERGFADGLVRRGVAIGEARRLILDQVATTADRTRSFPHVATPLGGRDERITRRDAVSAALLHRYSPTLFPLSDAAREYRGMTLLELAREFLGAAGVNVRGASRDEIATRALHSTSDFPEVLSAVTNKTLRQAYETYPRTFTPFCRQVLATDFKAMHRVQIGEAPQLLKVSEGGEFKRGTIAESKESYRIETYGRVVAITRQVLINDDLDAFTRIPAMYGTAIATLESDVVWGILTANAAMADGVTLFHATHKNLAGAGAAISVTTVGEGRAAMAKQTGLDKKTVLNIRPAFLIVPAALELTAEQLLAQNITPAKAGDVVPQSIRTLAPIAEPRLDAVSATAWYLAASPAQIDTIEYAYLEGQQGAYIETRNGFDVDGVEIKCRLDFGAKAIDWRGLYKNAGA